MNANLSSRSDRRSDPSRTLDSGRRIVPRKRCLRKATAYFNNTCCCYNGTLSDISATGAKIRFPAPTPLPNEIVLLWETSKRRAKVVWRKENSVGIAFV
jgi:hypothetical protein